METLRAMQQAAAAEERRVMDVFRARGTHDPRYGWFDAAHLLAMQELERRCIALLRDVGASRLEHARVLDVGCGTGFWLRRFTTWGADPARLLGVELLAERARQARRTVAPAAWIVRANGASLPVPDGSFDLVCQMLVFTSVLDETVRRTIASEMVRALAPGGTIVWYDYHVSNPANPDVRGVSRRELRSLFPGMHIQVRRLTLAPPLARAVAPRAPWLYHALAAVPVLRTHYLAAIRRPAESGARPSTPRAGVTR